MREEEELQKAPRNYHTVYKEGSRGFVDARERHYTVEQDGSARAMNKPQSRVKRLREERRRLAEQRKRESGK